MNQPGPRCGVARSPSGAAGRPAMQPRIRVEPQQQAAVAVALHPGAGEVDVAVVAADGDRRAGGQAEALGCRRSQAPSKAVARPHGRQRQRRGQVAGPVVAERDGVHRRRAGQLADQEAGGVGDQRRARQPLRRLAPQPVELGQRVVGAERRLAEAARRRQQVAEGLGAGVEREEGRRAERPERRVQQHRAGSQRADADRLHRRGAGSGQCLAGGGEGGGLPGLGVAFGGRIGPARRAIGHAACAEQRALQRHHRGARAAEADVDAERCGAHAGRAPGRNSVARKR